MDPNNLNPDTCGEPANDIWTLRTLLTSHPEWADLPIAVGESDGNLAYVGELCGSGMVYMIDEEEIEPVLVFSGD